MSCQHLCNCDCHQGMSMHFRPCCSPCEECKERIPNGKMQAHLEKCHPEAEEKE